MGETDNGYNDPQAGEKRLKKALFVVGVIAFGPVGVAVALWKNREWTKSRKIVAAMCVWSVLYTIVSMAAYRSEKLETETVLARTTSTSTNTTNKTSTTSEITTSLEPRGEEMTEASAAEEELSGEEYPIVPVVHENNSQPETVSEVYSPSVEEPTGTGSSGGGFPNTTYEDPAGECVIKGNVNSKGEKIYHTPASRSYKRTDIKPEEGDQMFCTIQEAEAAGFRRAEDES